MFFSPQFFPRLENGLFRRRPSCCVSFAINKRAMGSAAAEKKPERKTDEVERIRENGWRQKMAEDLVKRP